MKISTVADKNVVKDIRDRIKANDGYCPCASKRTPETKCMCKAFLEQEEGECHCGLYVKTKD